MGSEMHTQTQIPGQQQNGNATNTTSGLQSTWQRWEQDTALRRHVVENMWVPLLYHTPWCRVGREARGHLIVSSFNCSTACAQKASANLPSSACFLQCQILVSCLCLKHVASSSEHHFMSERGLMPFPQDWDNYAEYLNSGWASHDTACLCCKYVCMLATRWIIQLIWIIPARSAQTRSYGSLEMDRVCRTWQASLKWNYSVVGTVDRKINMHLLRMKVKPRF